MGKNISSYSLVNAPSLTDKLLGSKSGTDGTFNWSIEQILSLANSSPDLTRAELLDLASRSELLPSGTYTITDAVNGSTPLILTATTNNVLAEPCLNKLDISQIYIYDLANDDITPYSGGLPEAPNDGKQYGRQSESWTEVVGQIPEAPNDSKGYLRKSEGWNAFEQISLEETTNSLSFINEGGYVIASPSTPSSVASFDIVSNNAVAGTTVMIYYQGAAIPNFTSETVTNFTPDSFVPNELCLLTIIYHSVAGFTLYVNAPSEGFVKTETVSDASYVVSNLDRGKVIEFDNAGVSTSVELPTGILQGSVIGFVNNTGGILSFTAAGGVTIDSEGLNLETAATAASAISWGSDRFQLIGKLS